MSDPPLLEVNGLTIQYETMDGPITAVSDASFNIKKGNYFGLVGESGCGKTTMSLAILRGLDKNARITEGEVLFKGRDLLEMSEKELNNEIRWNEIAWIPQGSLDSLDPLEKISDQALELARTHSDLGKKEALDRFREMFEVVGLPPDRIHDYPHQFSGGMQQRAVISLALFLNPSLIVADEPTTALDVIMQDQIFKYLDEIKTTQNVSMLIITHDIALIFKISDRIAIMHSGQIAETGDVVEVFENPQHPYSIFLQESFPDIRYPDAELMEMEGYPPQLFGDVNSCTFSERCPWAIEECRQAEPPLESVDEDIYHEVACIRKDEIRDLYLEESDKSKPPQKP